MPSLPMYRGSPSAESIRPKHRPISAASSCASRWVYMPTMTSRSVRTGGTPQARTERDVMVGMYTQRLAQRLGEPSGGTLTELIEMRVEHGHVDLLLLHILLSHTLQGRQPVRLRARRGG